MSDYTPTLEVIRDAVTFPRERLGEPRPISGEAFDRFIEKIKAKARAEAYNDSRYNMQVSLDEAIEGVRARAWDEGYQAGHQHGDPMTDTDFPPSNPYRGDDA